MEFEPSEEQVDIRSQVRRLYDQGVKLVGQWCHRIPPLTMGKWKRWMSADGFMAWWVEMFPEHSSITIFDIRALEYESTQTLMAQISQGDMQAVQMAMKMVEMSRERTEVSSDQSLDKWFESEDSQWYD